MLLLCVTVLLWNTKYYVPTGWFQTLPCAFYTSPKSLLRKSRHGFMGPAKESQVPHTMRARDSNAYINNLPYRTFSSPIHTTWSEPKTIHSKCMGARLPLRLHPSLETHRISRHVVTTHQSLPRNLQIQPVFLHGSVRFLTSFLNTKDRVGSTE
jgi:hypothetical protein